MRNLFLLMVPILLVSFTTVPDLSRTRAEYIAATKDRAVAERNIEFLKRFPSDATANGYRGALTMIMASHVFNPVSKLRYFNSGKRILEDAISKEPGNTELRYLRLSVQSNLPSLLNYRASISNDRQYIISNFDDLKSPVVKTNAESLLKGNISDK